MVKLASVRGTRQYGPTGSKDIWEDVNALGFLIAALLLTVGSVLLLTGHGATVGFWLILVGLVFILIVNVHDLYAQVAGFDFRLPLVTLDPQLAIIEIAAPLVQALGAVVYFIAAFLLLRISRGDYSEVSRSQMSSRADELLIAAPALWLFGSILNAFQLYENTDLVVQAYQKGVTLPFVIGSVLLLLSGIINDIIWPPAAVHSKQMLVRWLALAGIDLYLLGGIVNAVRVIQLQRTQQQGGAVEKLRGGAEEALMQQRDEEEAYAPINKDDSYNEVEDGQHENPYKKSVILSDIER